MRWEIQKNREESHLEAESSWEILLWIWKYHSRFWKSTHNSNGWNDSSSSLILQSSCGLLCSIINLMKRPVVCTSALSVRIVQKEGFFWTQLLMILATKRVLAPPNCFGKINTWTFGVPLFGRQIWNKCSFQSSCLQAAKTRSLSCSLQLSSPIVLILLRFFASTSRFYQVLS